MPHANEMFGWICGSVFGLAMLILYVFVILWVYRDAEARGKSGCLVAILVTLISWPIGLIAWLIFRPSGRRF